MQAVTTVTDRVSILEGRVVEQTETLTGIREAIVHLEQRMDRRFEGLELRLDAIDRRFEGIDRRLDAIDRRFEGVDRRFEALDRRLEALDQRFIGIDQRFGGIDGRLLGLGQRLEILDTRAARQFMWLVGIQISTLVAVVAALIARS